MTHELSHDTICCNTSLQSIGTNRSHGFTTFSMYGELSFLMLYKVKADVIKKNFQAKIQSRK